ncbi:MAG: bifunctional alpha/beta hydrolase/OsmC family protein, partial [Bacteroidota bacterium]
MPKITKVSFTNRAGYELSARLELPIDRHPIAYALFAHCFTCGKNIKAARSISQCLTKNGIAVLRFDFAGLGNSEGDFSDTNFTSNIADLVAAANFLKDNYQAPSILIGHSLGGAAVLATAPEIDAVKAVVAIGAPAEPAHVQHLLQSSEAEILEKGQATVQLGQRSFHIKKQFLEDIQTRKIESSINRLGKALLILHSPQDRTVFIENAEKIYTTARHPKSFITLDGADHLLSNTEDGYYAGEVIASWVTRYLTIQEKKTIKSNSQVAVRLNKADAFTSEVKTGKYHFVADEPESVGGNAFGPTPYELVSSGLGACTVMTLHMYARRKKWDLQEATCHIDHHKSYSEDLTATDGKPKKIDVFDRQITLVGNLDESQKARLLEIADRCPVHRTLHGKV